MDVVGHSRIKCWSRGFSLSLVGTWLLNLSSIDILVHIVLFCVCVWDGVLCTVGYLAASLPSVHWILMVKSQYPTVVSTNNISIH